MTLLLLITPGIIASLYYCKMKGIPIKSFEFFIYALVFAFLILVFISSLAYLAGHKNVPTAELVTITGNAARYGLLGLISAFAFPNILFLLERIKIGKKA